LSDDRKGKIARVTTSHLFAWQSAPPLATSFMRSSRRLWEHSGVIGASCGAWSLLISFVWLTRREPTRHGLDNPAQLKHAIHPSTRIASWWLPAVKEVFNGQTVWEGVVHIFDLDNNSRATRPMRSLTMPKPEARVPRHSAFGRQAVAPRCVRAAIVADIGRKENRSPMSMPRMRPYRFEGLLAGFLRPLDVVGSFLGAVANQGVGVHLVRCLRSSVE